ncbi:hypothetical protein [Kribbella sp. VKM Ac-2568]|jgi:hypothetical protein|uniref:hypothetical protein n=1 Tax=Kribbella TaxID=182639 RepID=UPI0010E3AB61|nr:hypothetical protein [Kribbella sp. VKM Ac-2568]TCM41021.1 hypothetical protein EV648_11275 [Kribbella sp. VKM Ac-2568]
MYDMYPATWKVVDGRERKAARRRRPAPRQADNQPVQEAMNRRDNGGEPKK